MSNGSFRDFGLSEDIVVCLDALGYRQPTDVQNQVIPISLEKKDITVKSQTGSGKTAAFGIPICEMVAWKENKPQALILTPTRELAEQIKEDITHIGRLKRIKVTAVYGKQSFARQQAALKQKCHVVVGTPGRVLDHIRRETLPLARLKYLVIDEADEMLNMGFISQVKAIIQETPKDRVTMLFSATLPQEVEGLCHRHMRNPINVEIGNSDTVPARTKHSLFVVREEEKFDLLQSVTIVENPDTCIIFCGTQESVEDLFRRLAPLGYPCERIHGGMEQDDRIIVMNRFRRGEFRYLIATDVVARGIDIDDVTHVLNYDLPVDKERYVHRIGRTGRAGKEGSAITFVTPSEEGHVTDIEVYIQFQIGRLEFPTMEEVAQKRPSFEEKLNARPPIKTSRSEELDKDIMKLYFNGGKKKKIRAVDFVGTLAKINGVNADDIGIITILDHVSYVDILNGKGPLVLDAMKNTTIKGKLLQVHEAIDK